MTKKKHIMTFKEFLESKKRKEKSQKKQVDWDGRKKKWLSSINDLYEMVDKIIISNFIEAQYNVKSDKEEIRIIEDYIGAYIVKNYIINTESIKIIFNPIGTIIIGAYGRVNMVLPNETVKLVLPEWGQWKIVKGIAGSRELVDFDEKNIMEIFQDNL